jgi:thiol:disulfide interchange protein
VKQAMGVLLLGTALWLGWVLAQQRVEREPFAPQLAEALATDQIVFIDFTADWCVNCKVNERLVLNTDTVQRAFQQRNVKFLRADWTRGDPDITQLLKQFGRAAVPAYVIYPADRSRAPIVLPELLTTAIVLDALQQAETGG